MRSNSSQFEPGWAPAWLGATDAAGRWLAMLCVVVGMFLLRLPKTRAEIVASWPGFPQGAVRQIEVVDNLAFATLWPSSVAIFDVTDIDRPVRRGGCNVEGSADGIQVVGKHAYVAAGSLQILNISDPRNPVRVGQSSSVVQANSVRVRGRYAYLGGWKGFEVFDVSDPTRPARVGLLRSEVGGEVVEVSGNRAYVLAPSAFALIDVSNPARPTEMTSVYLAGLSGLQVIDDRVYLTRLFDRGLILDLSHPDSPTSIGAFGGIANSIHVVGSFAYLINDAGGLTLFDVSNPASPRMLLNGSGRGLSRLFAVAGSLVFVTEAGGGARILDLTNMDRPLERGRFAVPISAQTVTAAGGFAYLGDSQGGFHVLDVSQSRQPVRVGCSQLPRLPTDVAVADRHAYVVDGSELQVLDLSNPSNLVSVGKLATKHTRIRTLGNLAFTCGYWDDVGEGRTLSLFDIRDAAHVKQLGTVSLPGHGRALDIIGNYACVAMGGTGARLAVINIDPPTSPWLVGTYGTEGGAVDLRIVGTRGYLAVNQGATKRMGLETLDLSDPVRPAPLSFFQTQSAPTGLEVADDVVHLALGERGVLQVNVRDPKNPVCAGGFDTPGFASQISISNGKVFVADGVFGLSMGAPATNGAPYLVTEPESQIVDAGFRATFRVQAECQPVRYQWRFNGSDLPTATNDTLVIPSVSSNHAGLYSAVVGNSLGSVTSAVASLTVEWLPPSVRLAVTNLHVESGAPLSVVAAVVGSPPLVMQWLLNGQPIPGATGSWLLVDKVDTTWTGRYSLVVSNGVGTVNSSDFTVTVDEVAPRVFVTPRMVSALVGDDVSLVPVQVTGAPYPALQWQFNGVDLPGETNAQLKLVRVQPSRSGSYTLVARNGAGVGTSEPLRVSVEFRAPELIDAPTGDELVATEGSDVILRAKAVGGPPPEFHLHRDGTNRSLPYAFRGGYAVFHLGQVSTNDSGSYRIVASNPMGLVVSPATSLRVTGAGPFDRWSPRNPLPQSQSILSMVHSKGLFVGVGERGLVITSSDGVDWVPQRRLVDVPLRSVTWAAGQFIAVGGGGVILGSNDGTNWTHRYSARASFPNPVGDTELGSVVYGNGRFVALGYGSLPTAYTSEEGEMWEPHTVTNGSLWLASVAFGDGLFVAVGQGSYTSVDGMNWTQQPFPNGPSFDSLRSVQFLNHQFVAVGYGGKIHVRPRNAPEWSDRSVDPALNLVGVTFGGGQYVAAGARGTILVSEDAEVWRQVDSGTRGQLETIAYSGERFVAAGENGSMVTSRDGPTWTQLVHGTAHDLDGMVVTRDLAVVVGKAGTVLRSKDGENFVEQASGTTNHLHGVAWANGLFVAVGALGEIVTSRDAVNWTRRESGCTNYLKAAAFGAGSWVVVGTQGRVLTSPDGEDWTRQDIASVLMPKDQAPPLDLNDVVWGNGSFVMVGDGPFGRDGAALRSVDGRVWDEISRAAIDSRKRKNIRSITFADGRFLATCNDGYLLTSTNARDWSGRLCPVFAGRDQKPNLRNAAFVFGTWMVAGNEGVILTSTNAIDWTPRPSRTLENLHGIGALGGRVLAVGNRGTVLQSDQLVPSLELPIRSDGMSRVRLRGVEGHSYRVEASRDFAAWTLLRTITNVIRGGGPILIDDPSAAVESMRFYRLKEE